MAVKQRMKSLFTGGLTVGQLAQGASPGTYIKHIVAGSATFECGSIGAVGGSSVCEVVTMPGLTASHAIAVSVRTGNACTVFQRSNAGAGQASLFFSYVGGSGLGAASQTTTTIDYLGWQT